MNRRIANLPAYLSQPGKQTQISLNQMLKVHDCVDVNV